MDGTNSSDVDDAVQPYDGDNDPGYSDSIKASVAPDHDECMRRDCLNYTDFQAQKKRMRATYERITSNGDGSYRETNG